MLSDSVCQDIGFRAATRAERAAGQVFDLDSELPPANLALPDWVKQFANALATPYVWAHLQKQFPQSLHQEPTAGFLKLVAPLLQSGLNQLEAHLLRSHDQPPPSGSSVGASQLWPTHVGSIMWESLLLNQLLILNATLILELHVARLQGRLTGTTSAERFACFTDSLLQPEIRCQLFHEYPVLARLAYQSVQQWTATSAELLIRLHQDWPQICQTFQVDGPGQLQRVKLGMGDQHRDGRSVAILQFSSGWRLVYKPRSCQMEQKFQTLITWVNRQQVCPPLHSPQILAKTGYGWMAYVHAQPCPTPAQLQRFYQRQGAYLALLHVLAATDLHYENVIAVGEDPMLIDLEALCQPQEHQPWADTLAQKAVAASVLRVGLLPQPIWGHAQAASIDLSGLSGEAGQRSPDRIPQLVDVGTDQMRLERDFQDLGGSHNQPQLGQAATAPQLPTVLTYAEDILQGFTQMYHLLWQQSAEVQQQLDGFDAAETRVILRASRTYALLLRESYHPNLLRDALAREQLFDKLDLDAAQRPGLNQVVAIERQALWQGDIPVFHSQVDHTDLTSPSPLAKVPDFFQQPSKRLIQERLVQLGSRDLAWQIWAIRASLATLAMNQEPMPSPALLPHLLSPPVPCGFSIAPHSDPDQSDLGQRESAALAIAIEIGERLQTLAYQQCEPTELASTWLGINLTADGQQWAVAPLGTSLYDGLAGIALFLAYLGKISQRQEFTDLAQQALVTLQQQLRLDPPTMLGAFSGWGGIFYTYSHLGQLWQAPQLWQQALDYLEPLTALIATDPHFDLIAGAAGGLMGLLSLLSVYPDARLLLAAEQCGQHLLTHAQPAAGGVGWPNPSGTGGALTGLAHGNAGIALALSRLAVLTGNLDFQHLSTAALAYERQAFDPIQQNWHDARSDSPHTDLTKGMAAWCHGAAGVGLARLQMLATTLPHQDVSVLISEIHIALQTTLRNGFDFNHCLCHGDLGNVELLAQAAQHWPAYQASYQHQAHRILERIQAQGWRTGLPLPTESPGLMTGLAGIGYGLLRLAKPGRVPSLLTLQPPLVSP